MTRLLDKEENTRLGSMSGASEAKQHKWFAKVNWGLLRHTEPPVRICCLPLGFPTAACSARPSIARGLRSGVPEYSFSAMR